jgi:hypothetical protein
MDGNCDDLYSFCYLMVTEPATLEAEISASVLAAAFVSGAVGYRGSG